MTMMKSYYEASANSRIVRSIAKLLWYCRYCWATVYFHHGYYWMNEKHFTTSIGTKMANMNFEQFHFMHRWFIRIELSCVALNWWTESKITNTHICFRIEHLQHTPLRSLILMQPYRSLSQALICHCELSIKLYICLFANRQAFSVRHWISNIEWIAKRNVQYTRWPFEYLHSIGWPSAFLTPHDLDLDCYAIWYILIVAQIK